MEILGICILLLAGVVVYCNKRVSELETALQRLSGAASDGLTSVNDKAEMDSSALSLDLYRLEEIVTDEISNMNQKMDTYEKGLVNVMLHLEDK